MKINRQRQQDLLAALLIAAVFCLPMLNGMIRNGSDTSFHMERILRLAEAIRHGDFYPRIFPDMHMYYGYGSPLFYSVCLLYPAAILVLLHVPLLMTYRILLFGIAFFAAYAMIRLCRSFAKHRWSPWIAAGLYILNPFVLANAYKRGAIGELLALIFLPVIIKGVHELFVLHKRSLVYLTLGFGGLLLSHNITFILSLILLAVFCVFNLKKDNVKETGGMLFQALFLAFLLTAFFSLPMLEQLSSHLYRISDYAEQFSLADNAIIPYQYFSFDLGDSVNMCICPGLCALLAIGVLKYGSRFEKQLFLFGTGLLAAGTVLFPWKYLSAFSFLQFPARVITPAVALLSAASVPSVDRILSGKQKSLKVLMAGILLGLGGYHLVQLYNNWGIFNDSLTTDEIFSEDFIYGERSWYNRLELSTPDYLPGNAEINFYEFDHDHVHYGEELIDLERGYGNTVFFAERAGEYLVPKTYYKGYQAAGSNDEGKKISTYSVSIDEQTGLLRVNVSDEGVRVRVRYGSTPIQIISDLISLSGVGLITILWKKRKLSIH